MSLEDLERNLYSKKSEKLPARRVRKFSRAPLDERVPESWSERAAKEETERAEEHDAHEPRPIVQKILLAGIAFVLIVGVVAAFVIFGSVRRGSGNVSLVVTPVAEVLRGVPFEVSINIDNRSDEILREATLTAHVPTGIAPFTVNGGTTALVSEPVGDIGGGSLARKTFRFLPIGPEHSTQRILFTLTYTSGSRNRFEVEKEIAVPIGASAITLDVEQPTHILSGSSFEFTVRYENVSNFDFPEVVLEAQYPNAFLFESANFPPDSLTNYWKLGELRAGSKGELIIRGSASGFDASRFTIPVSIAANFLGKEYPLTTYTSSISIAPSPINIQIAVNRRLDYVARIGDRLNYTIHYENNSGIPLSDVVVRATLSGELFNIGSLSTIGQLDSITNTVTWNAGTIPTLKLVPVGGSGEVSFDINLVDSFPIRRLSDKNFLLRVKSRIDSPSVPFYLNATQTAAESSLDTKVAGAVAVDARAFYRDALSSIANQGTLPPKVNMPTEYTIHWVITNYATDLKNVTVRGALEAGVSWTGIVKSNVDSVPLYNDRTQEIIWKIDAVQATKGIIGAPIEAIFQVRAVPNVTQVNQVQPLIRETILRATDDFTGLELSATDVGISTDLPDDKTVGQGGGIVVP